MKRNSTNIGFIGFGRVVEWQINQMKGLNISIKFVFDICDNKLNTAREIIPEAKLYNNIEELFNNKSLDNIDYVVIATPSGSHFNIAQKIVENKSWKIIIEKPTFLYFDHFLIAKNWRNKIVPIFQNRYNKSVIKAKKLLENNSIGEITHASLALDWERPQRYYDLASWRGTWLNDGGVSTNQGIHYFDIARHLLGSFSHVNAKMRRLAVNIECEDYLNASFEMVNGIPLDVRMTTAIRHSKEEASLVINGSLGRIKLHGICCNLLDCNTEDISLNSFGENVEMAYGYGHKTFFELISSSCDNENLKLPNLTESFETMQFIYSSYSSAISGKESVPKINYYDVPLGKQIKEHINFE